MKAGGRARRGSAAPAARLLACLSSRRDARALARARASTSSSPTMPNHRCARAVAAFREALLASSSSSSSSSRVDDGPRANDDDARRPLPTIAMPREGPRPPRERARDDARARLAFLLIACLSVTCAGAEDASASASASAAAWTPPICGGISADDCAASLLAWEKDVRALQSLHRSCGGGNEWPGAWAPVPSFNGTLDDWKALCGAEGASSEGAAELACDADGRIATLRWKQSVKLSCPEIGFPEAFADLTELRVLEMRGAFTTGKMLVSRLLSATTTLTLKKLTTIDLGGNSLAGAPPSMCDVGAFASGAAATLTTLRLNDNALTGPPPAAFASCLSSLEELDVSDNDLTGQLPDAWAAMGALQTLRASDNARLGGVVPPAWFADRSAMNALQTIEMRRCGLSGPIPPGIFNATDAKVIDLRENALNGSLPAAAGGDDATRRGTVPRAKRPRRRPSERFVRERRGEDDRRRRERVQRVAAEHHRRGVATS